jgi:hypothetical protein
MKTNLSIHLSLCFVISCTLPIPFPLHCTFLLPFLTSFSSSSSNHSMFSIFAPNIIPPCTLPHRLSSHLKYNFPSREGTGIRDMITHASADCVDLIEKLIAYNPEERVTARQVCGNNAPSHFVLQIFFFLQKTQARLQIFCTPDFLTTVSFPTCFLSAFLP